MAAKTKLFDCVCQLDSCKAKFFAYSAAAKFCSDACRQKHHRIAHGAAANRREGAIKAGETKAHQFIWLTCENPNCKREFSMSGTGAGNTMYCSNACKQAAHRQRKGLGLSAAMLSALKYLRHRGKGWIAPRTADALINRGLIQKENWQYSLTEQGEELLKTRELQAR